jgi:hypothetical protein
MTTIVETNGTTAPATPKAPKRKAASKATRKPKPRKVAKRRATTSRKGAARTKPGTRGVMAKAGDYAMVVRIPEALHRKMWAWAKKQDDSLSGLVRKAIERLVR